MSITNRVNINRDNTYKMQDKKRINYVKLYRRSSSSNFAKLAVNLLSIFARVLLLDVSTLYSTNNTRKLIVNVINF